MRAGRGIRVAALLTAGLVGAAIIAPGIASATTTPTCGADQTVDATGQCVPLAGSGSSTDTGTTGSATTGTGATGSGAGSGTTSDTTTAPTTSEQVPTTSGGATGSSGAGASSDATSPGATVTGDATGNAGAPADRTAPAVGTPEAATADTPAAVSDAASALTGTAATGSTLGDVLGSLPTGNLTGLGTIPALPDTGTFASPQDACLYLASKVNAPTGQEGALGGQFSSFCGSLPESFAGLDLTGLITKLTDLLKGLEATPTHPGSTSTRPVHTSWGDLPASFHDLDCGQLSYDEAQAILADDPSDPNRLDGDHDGVACERNPHDYAKVCDTYDGYPVGAVATGDSAPVVVPGAAAALGALALAGLAGAAPARVRRTEDPDEADDADLASADLVTAGER